MKTSTHSKAIRLADYRPAAFVIDNAALTIALDPAATVITSKLQLRENPLSKQRAAKLHLDGEFLELNHIALDGQPLAPECYHVTDTGLTLNITPKGPFVLDITTTINPSANTALQGLYLSRNVFCSQCEAQGFRRISYFIDRPDVMAKYRVRLEADIATAPVLLANGNPVERGTLAGGKRHYAVWADPHPKPSYLFAVVGGDLSPVASTFKTMSGRTVDLKIYVEHGKEARAHWAMDALKRSMTWDEKYFGREYDLDVFNIVAVSDFNMGAMENKGLNIFNDRLVLASPETATDGTYESIESVVAHEYFHNWTGNRITCRDWFQLCLKEGLTVYRDQEFSSDERSRTVQRITDVKQLRALQFPEDQGPLAHAVRPESYVEINNFYTPTVYEKGAEIVRMIATILGAQAFRAGMDLYFERHDGTAATIEDFVTCFEDASGKPLKHFMRWYSQPGTPELVCDFKYDQKTKTAELSVEQVLHPTPGQPKKQPLYIPLRLGLLGANGQDIDLEIEGGEILASDVVAITKRKQTIKFKNVPSRPVPSVLRGFSAPVNLTMRLNDHDLISLMANDSDLFNRWQAVERGLMRALMDILNDTVNREKGLALANAIKSILENPELDDAYKAEIIKLPAQSDIARELRANVDPTAIYRAHKGLGRRMAAFLNESLLDLYAKRQSKGFTPDAKSAGKRALRNAALTLLSFVENDANIARIEQHYRAATNMTDQSCALILLAGIECGARDRVIADFYERWKGDHLVIDTWFAVQAMSPLDGTLGRVNELLKDPLFSLKAPNKVRALIGTFAAANPVQFNRPDGTGYQFVTKMALQIDRLNPQIAARLMSAFRSYRALEANRQALAKSALETVNADSHISRDLREIVERMLEI